MNGKWNPRNGSTAFAWRAGRPSASPRARRNADLFLADLMGGTPAAPHRFPVTREDADLFLDEAFGETTESPDPAPAPLPRPDPLKTEPASMTCVAAAQHTYIKNAKGEIIATVDQGTPLKITGKPNDAQLRRVRNGEFVPKPGDTQPGIYDLYYEIEYFGRMGGGAKDAPIKAYVDTSWVSLTAAPAGPSASMTANDWMTDIPDEGDTGDAAKITAAATAINAERQGIEARAFINVAKKPPTIPRDGVMSKDDARTTAYKAWLNLPDTRPALAKSTSDIRWLAFKHVFDAEGDPSKIMTYDATNITWGVGFSGAGSPGVGLTEQMMARLFNQSSQSRDAFWRAGITVVGTTLVAVRITNAAAGKADKLRGTAAENFVRNQPALLSLMTNVTIGIDKPGQKDPDIYLRQQNLDAQFETFLNNTLVGSDGIIDGMSGDPVAAAVAAHSVHTGQHGWGQYRGVTTKAGVESAITARISAMRAQNAEAKAKGEKPKFSFIVPLSQIEANIK